MSGQHRKGRGEYRAIYTSIADDFDFVPLHRHAKLLFYTLKMKLGVSGIGVAFPGTLADLTGIPYPEIDAGLSELEVTQWILRDQSVVWIRNGLLHDPGINLRNRHHVIAIISHLGRLPRSRLIPEFCTYYNFDISWIENGVPEPFPAPSTQGTPGEVPRVPGAEYSGSGEEESRREVEKEKELPEKKRAWKFCPDDWTPNEKHQALADQLRVDLPTQEAAFRDHEFKDAKTDANRAFSRWLRTAKSFGSAGAQKGDASARLRSKADQTTDHILRLVGNQP